MISFAKKKQLAIEDILITALLEKPKLPYLMFRDFEMFMKAPIITNQTVRKYCHPKPNKPIAKSWSAPLAPKVIIDEIDLGRYLLSGK
ncbi:hypothetical protein N8540_07100 [Gammaproteobacteria bacterium]|jgi:hypothetical protein|nr:hypothetical protein [Gammaproteobacteria bacterium]MDC1423342.1 hypothetical protein [Gammaproteobacteria bacterium]MDC1512109.1 hypothetical protein [Gammaproteobacteria bacterium]